MKIERLILRLLFVAVPLALSGAGCRKSVAADPPPAPAAPPAQSPKENQPAKAGGWTVKARIPKVLISDPLHKELFRRLNAAHETPLSENATGLALKEVFDGQLPPGVENGPVKCYGEPKTLVNKTKELTRIFREKPAMRKAVLSGWPLEGCAMDVRYSKATAVVALDEITIDNRESQFNRWRGTSGRTAPRFESHKKGKAIVATWYFLPPVKAHPYGTIEPVEICKVYNGKNCEKDQEQIAPEQGLKK